MGPTRIGDYEIRYDDEETLQYEVVEPDQWQPAGHLPDRA